MSVCVCEGGNTYKKKSLLSNKSSCVCESLCVCVCVCVCEPFLLLFNHKLSIIVIKHPEVQNTVLMNEQPHDTLQ